MTYGLIKIHSEVLSSLLIKWILEILSCKCILKGLETGTSDRSLICIIQRLRFSGFSLYPLSFFLSLQLDLFSPTSSSNFYVVFFVLQLRKNVIFWTKKESQSVVNGWCHSFTKNWLTILFMFPGFLRRSTWSNL